MATAPLRSGSAESSSSRRVPGSPPWYSVGPWPAILGCATAAAPEPKTASRAAKDTGLTNLPLHELNQNRIWQANVALACEITAWTPLLAFTEHPALRWEPKRPRLRIFSLPAHAARHARRVVLHLPTHTPWAGLALDGLTRLRALAVPG